MQKSKTLAKASLEENEGYNITVCKSNVLDKNYDYI